MRISAQDRRSILQALHPYISEPSTLYLYGSRVDDQRRGGDIDLLLLTSQRQRNQLIQKKHILLCDIKEKIGEQKIDLTIAKENDKDQDPFLKSILSKAIILAQL